MNKDEQRVLKACQLRNAFILAYCKRVPSSYSYCPRNLAHTKLFEISLIMLPLYDSSLLAMVTEAVFSRTKLDGKKKREKKQKKRSK